MQIVGRIVKQAEVNQVKDERKVVNFSVAVNEYYKPKGGEGVKTTLFINCSYWITTKIATQLTKGAIVEINGRLYLGSYMGYDQKPKATLNCHVNQVKIHQFSKESDTSEVVSKSKKEKEEVAEDLPF